jgi:hypothetical protein
VTARVIVAITIIVVAALIAWTLERRRRPSVPTQGTATIPQQLDRRDFPRPEAAWLIVLWSSRNCESCRDLFDKIAPLASEDVAVVEVEYQVDPDLHRRYRIDAAPITIVTDRDGVTRASFAGTFAASDVWGALAALRSR